MQAVIDHIRCEMQMPEQIKQLFVTEMVTNVISVENELQFPLLLRELILFIGSWDRRPNGALCRFAAVSAEVDSGMHAGPGEVMMTHYEFHCGRRCLTLQSPDLELSTTESRRLTSASSSNVLRS